MSNPSAAPLRALVVDDSTTLRRLMELTLTPLGFDIDFTDNGEDAVRLVSTRPYDLVFLDVVLPGKLDGYAVCKRIKGDKLTKDTPVIMLTSQARAFDKVRGIMAGTNVYLTKPLNEKELLAAIRKHVPSANTMLSQTNR